MRSKLSQRLRAARNYADLRQQDIADACALAGHKVSRGAVAQWEYEDERATVPSIEQIKAVSKRTKVPLDWLLNDNVDPSSVWQYATQSVPVAPQTFAPPPKSPVTDRMADAFAKSVEFSLLQRAPALADGFTHTTPAGAIPAEADFVLGDMVVELKTYPPGPDAIGRLLLIEQALGIKAKKLYLYLAKGAPQDILGVQVIPVETPEEAARAIISAAR